MSLIVSICIRPLFFSFRRAANKIKYLAGSESGMAAWISDTTPELIAKRFHELGPIDIEG